MSREIEPGALVIVCHPTTPVHSATVLARDPFAMPCGFCGSVVWWEVDDGWAYSECFLHRIDGHTEAERDRLRKAGGQVQKAIMAAKESAK